MKQSWQIYNISKGLSLGSITDDDELFNKSISIDLLLYLLQNKWKNDKIVITGNFDDTYNSSSHMKDCIDYFLSNYNIKYNELIKKSKKDLNLYNLEYNGLIPKESEKINVSVDYIDTFCQFQIEIEELNNNFDEIELNSDIPKLYINDNGLLIDYEKYNIYNTYAFVNHSKRMYVLFNNELLENNFLEKKYNNTFPNTNDLVKKIVIYLLVSHSAFGRGENEVTNGYEEYIGMWCNDNISFERNNQIIASYKNISQLFSKKSRSYSLSLSL